MVLTAVVVFAVGRVVTSSWGRGGSCWVVGKGGRSVASSLSWSSSTPDCRTLAVVSCGGKIGTEVDENRVQKYLGGDVEYSAGFVAMGALASF